jgi:hypothetical protein
MAQHVVHRDVFNAGPGHLLQRQKRCQYDLLKREEINWRALNSQTARAVYQQHTLTESRTKAFVLDDSIKTRRGKKMEGVSSHYNHVRSDHCQTTVNNLLLTQQLINHLISDDRGSIS